MTVLAVCVNVQIFPDLSQDNVGMPEYINSLLFIINLDSSSVIIWKILPQHKKKRWRVPGKMFSLCFLTLDLQKTNLEMPSERMWSSDFARHTFHLEHNENKYRINHLSDIENLLICLEKTKKGITSSHKFCFHIFVQQQKSNFITKQHEMFRKTCQFKKIGSFDPKNIFPSILKFPVIAHHLAS